MKRDFLSKKAVKSKIHYINSQLEPSKTQKNAKASSYLGKFPLISDKLLELKPALPTYFSRPNSIKKATKFFIDNFQTPQYLCNILYSVKSNPDETVLKNLFANGITKFDVASMNEVKLINKVFGPKAEMYFMHPVKSREAIFDAYFNHNIKDFSLDSFDELEKILAVTKNAKDLNLHIRLAISNSHAAIDLSSKFGILPSGAIALLRKARGVSNKLGICFHVGSQCMDPKEYRNAIKIAKETIDAAGVNIDILDIGGGFPSSYPGMTPPDLQSYFDAIFDAISHIDFGSNCQIWCEPGRALVAESSSLLVRVEARKENMLYLNDGTYGGLFDAGTPGFIFPTKARTIREKEFSKDLTAFGFYGPTCDALDVMKGPFYLPNNIGEGDYIEIGGLGAYSRSIRTDFNGFDENLLIEF